MTVKIKSSANIDISNNLKSLIESSGVKKADLIRQLQLSGISMSKQRLYKLEHGQANITADELATIAEIIQCDVAAFFKKTSI